MVDKSYFSRPEGSIIWEYNLILLEKQRWLNSMIQRVAKFKIQQKRKLLNEFVVGASWLRRLNQDASPRSDKNW